MCRGGKNLYSDKKKCNFVPHIEHKFSDTQHLQSSKMNKVLPLLALPLASTAASAQNSNTEGDTPKNLVIVMADQWRGDAIGILGREEAMTPNLDRFAQNGVMLTEAVSSIPVSSPARAMFLTGAYPWNNGVPTNCNSASAKHGVELHKDIVTWSDVLKSEGYSLGYIGKWHLDAPHEPFIDTYNNRGEVAWNEWCPADRRHGFDYWFAYGTYDYHTKPMYWDNPKDRDDWKYYDEWGPVVETDRAIEFFEANKDKPFALMVSMNPPHTGYELVPQKYKDMYKELDVDSIINSRPNIINKQYYGKSLPDYYACMTGVDEQFGRIYDALIEKGLLENTILVFVSDHGDMMGVHDHLGKNIFYEEAMRVPVIFGGAGIKARMDDRLLFNLDDFNPTILAMLGYKERIPESSQTRDLSKQIIGRSKKNTNGQFYLRTWYENPKEPKGARGWRDLRYTYSSVIVDGEFTDEVLFDRKNDPFQLHNLINEKPAIAKRMKRTMVKHMKEIDDPIYPTLK